MKVHHATQQINPCLPPVAARRVGATVAGTVVARLSSPPGRALRANKEAVQHTRKLFSKPRSCSATQEAVQRTRGLFMCVPLWVSFVIRLQGTDGAERLDSIVRLPLTRARFPFLLLLYKQELVLSSIDPRLLKLAIHLRLRNAVTAPTLPHPSSNKKWRGNELGSRGGGRAVAPCPSYPG